jgi:hypothetical protein
MVDPKWKEFEKLVEKVYKKLSPDAKIEHDVKIRGIETGKNRQIDICIRQNVAGHDVLIIIQCKDLSRKADINVVGTFASVVKDVKASKGVLVCNAGFSADAIEYAKNVGIDTYGIYDSSVEGGGLLVTMPTLWIDLVPIFNAGIRSTGRYRISSDINQWRFKYKNYPVSSLRELFGRLWNEEVFEHSPGERSYNLPDKVSFITEEGEHPVELKFNVKVREQYYFRNVPIEDTEGLVNFADDSYITKDLYVGFNPEELGKSWKEIKSPDELAVSPACTLCTVSRFPETKDS